MTQLTLSFTLSPPSKHSLRPDRPELCERGGIFCELARQEGAPAQMALCESVGRKAAGGGDESAAWVDAGNEQPVKHGNFVSDRQLPSNPWQLAEPERNLTEYVLPFIFTYRQQGGRYDRHNF